MTPMPGTRGLTPVGRPQRADARRNIAAILEAALTCLTRDPQASVLEIAQAAGVGKVTFYGHFRTRAELVEAVMQRAVAQSDIALDGTDLTGDPRDALTRLVGSAWQLLYEYRAVMVAAERELPADRVRAHHEKPMRRVTSLVRRGRREGVFRTDLPASWLVTLFYGVLHVAGNEYLAGRLQPDAAARTITATLLAGPLPKGRGVHLDAGCCPT